MEDFIENYAQIPQSKRILYALVAGVVIVVLFLVGVHNEEEERYQRMQNQVTKLDRDVTKKRAYVQNMEKYKQRFQQLELTFPASLFHHPAEAAVQVFHGHFTGSTLQFTQLVEYTVCDPG